MTGVCFVCYADYAVSDELLACVVFQGTKGLRGVGREGCDVFLRLQDCPSPLERLGDVDGLREALAACGEAATGRHACSFRGVPNDGTAPAKLLECHGKHGLRQGGNGADSAQAAFAVDRWCPTDRSAYELRSSSHRVASLSCFERLFHRWQAIRAHHRPTDHRHVRVYPLFVGWR